MNDEIIYKAKNNNQEIEEVVNQEDCIELHEYLNKFIELVPNLKELNQQEKIKKILCSIQLQNCNSQLQALPQQEQSLHQQLDSLKNLEISPVSSITDLQILQSVLDYILELKCFLHD